MRGCIRKRYRNSWNIIIDLGYLEYKDPETGETRKKRNQKWFTVQGTKKDAEAKLTEILNDFNKGQYIEPSKLTFGEWLDEWLDTAIKPPNKRLSTYIAYIGRSELNMAKILLAWRCRVCKTIIFNEKADPTGPGRNLPNYCTGCGVDVDLRDLEYVGTYEAREEEPCTSVGRGS